MSNSSPRALATATVELVRDTSRRLSADLRDMSRDFGNEFRNMGREIRDMHREIGQRFRSSSLQGVPRIEIPRIGLPSFTDSPRYTTIDDAMIPQGYFNSTNIVRAMPIFINQSCLLFINGCRTRFG